MLLRFRWLQFCLVVTLICIGFCRPSRVTAQSGLSISGITDNRAGYSGSTIPKFSKLEISFTVTGTVATNLQFPYDPTPPPGITPGTGITVTGEFSPDNWVTTYSQPAFYYQDYSHQVKNGQDWIYPTGSSFWVVRFAPDKLGSWQYRLKATDAGGNTVSGNQTFTVGSSTSKGFIKVSPTDARYLEYGDGTFFPGLGYNLNFSQLDWQNPLQSNLTKLQTMGQNGIQFIRIWLSQWQIFGEMWNGWKYTVDGGYDHLTFNPSYVGSDVSLSLDTQSDLCMGAAEWLQAPIGLKQNTTYRVKVRVKTMGLTGPKLSGYPYGFVVKTGDPDGDLSWMGRKCDNPTLGTRMTGEISGDNDWQIIEGTYNSGSHNYLSGIYLTLENTTAGKAYVDYVWMKEDTGNWDTNPNILEQPWMAHHQYYDQRMSYAFDLTLNLAEQNGVYLKPVLMDHNDWIMNSIDYSGNYTGSASNNNFYGNWRTMTKVRWLQQNWWRYVQARWGYSTAIQSWEIQNEGDPWSGLHYTLTDEFGKYMHCGVFGEPMGTANGWLCPYHHPDSHLVTDSNWHSFPVAGFWHNANYPNIDMADFHLYYQKTADSVAATDTVGNLTISTPATWYDTALVAKTQSDAIGALTAAGARKPTVIGESGFTDSGSEPGSAELYQDTQGIWLHNYLWAGLTAGGVYNSGYWYSQADQIYCTGCTYNGVAYTYDHRPEFGNFYRFIKDLPLTNGHYLETSASSSNPTLRVWGQKDTLNNRAHLWISNPAHTWKNVINNVAITPITSSITIPGFTTSAPLKVEWWDTYRGIATATASATPVNGVLTLSVNNLTADTAVKIGDYTGNPAPLPGDFNGDGVVDYRDWFTFIPNFGSSNSTYKLVPGSLVNIFDLNNLVGLLFK